MEIKELIQRINTKPKEKKEASTLLDRARVRDFYRSSTYSRAHWESFRLGWKHGGAILALWRIGNSK